MILSVHQPNYIPWIGYFFKIQQSDIFVFLDDVQVPRGRSVANRNLIKGINAESRLLTVPFKKSGNSYQTYLEAEIDYTSNWQHKHLVNIIQCYKKAPYFKQYYPDFEKIINENYGCLAMLNINIIQSIISELGFQTKIYRSSEIQADIGFKNDRIVNICRYFSADTYLSGEGARSYNDPVMYQSAGIKLEYSNFKHPEYDQINNSFLPNLSILDLIFNVGFNNSSELIKESEQL